MALQYAKIAGASVLAVDVTDDKLAMARTLGADYTVNAAQEDPVAAIKRLVGADAAIALRQNRSSRPSAPCGAGVVFDLAGAATPSGNGHLATATPVVSG